MKKILIATKKIFRSQKTKKIREKRNKNLKKQFLEENIGKLSKHTKEQGLNQRPKNSDQKHI